MARPLHNPKMKSQSDSWTPAPGGWSLRARPWRKEYTMEYVILFSVLQVQLQRLLPRRAACAYSKGQVEQETTIASLFGFAGASSRLQRLSVHSRHSDKIAL